MKKSLCIMLMLLASGIGKTAFAQTEQYFKTLVFRETPFAPHAGIHQIANAQRSAINHYVFEYDDNGKLTEIRFELGGTLKRPNWHSWFFFMGSRVTIETMANKEIHRWFDEGNERTTIWGDVWEQEYSLDELGRRVQLRFKNKEGQYISNAWGIHQYQWQHHTDGTVREKRFDSNGEMAMMRPGFDFYELKLHYDVNGRLALMQNLGKDGKLTHNRSGVSMDKITFDEHGNYQSWTVLDNNWNWKKGNIPNVAHGLRTINKGGYETQLITMDENKNIINAAWGLAKIETDWDSYGNVIETRLYTADGKPTDQSRFGPFFKSVNHWSKDGKRLLRQERFDAKNNKATKGYATRIFEFDDKGRRTGFVDLDSAGESLNN